MFKKFAFSALALIAFGAAEAKAGDFVVLKGSITVTQVAVSNASPTQVDPISGASAAIAASRKFISVQNTSTTDDIRCAWSPLDVSPTTGTKLAPGASLTALALARNGKTRITIYCQAAGAAPVNVAVTQGF